MEELVQQRRRMNELSGHNLIINGARAADDAAAADVAKFTFAPSVIRVYQEDRDVFMKSSADI